VYAGYEQANKYSIKNMEGQVVGYIAEEDGLGRSLLRNVLRTRRPFHATVMDALGNVVLKVGRGKEMSMGDCIYRYVSYISNIFFLLVELRSHEAGRHRNTDIYDYFVYEVHSTINKT
jgi:hypothetical protein